MIEVNNLTKIDADKRLLLRVAKKVLKGENIEKEIELSIVLAGPGKIKELNRKYRKKNEITDVLSFGEISAGKNENFLKDLSEIVICPEVVKKNAKINKVSFEKELVRVLIHGILHIAGYDHEKNLGRAKEMREKEEFYLKKTNY